jgi:membrane protein
MTSRRQQSRGNRKVRSFVIRNTLRRMLEDQCLDRAAGLSFFGLLSAAPAILALVSLLGVIGEAEPTAEAVLSLAHDVSPEATSAIRPIVTELVEAPSAGVTLIGSLLVAIWSASKYVGAFSRAMNQVYRVEEGRPFWKLKPLTLLITVVLVTLLAALGMLLVLSGPVAKSLGGLIGMGETALLIWNAARWPVFILVIIVLLAVLYYVTPNVRQPKFRWVSVGALIALLTLLVVSAGFVFYINHFNSVNATYGSIGGVIVGLVWVWMVNLSLLLGAEFDAEFERGRQLRAGIAAEETIRLPLRDARQIRRARKKRAEVVDEGRALRQTFSDQGPQPFADRPDVED